MFNKPDYTVEGFILPIERDGVKGYASINAELYRDEDGLDRTGNYLVYLLHPIMGSANFTLEPDGAKGFEKIEVPVWLKEDIIEEITKAIEVRNSSIKSQPSIYKN
jgi:hypothetical protein